MKRIISIFKGNGDVASSVAFGRLEARKLEARSKTGEPPVALCLWVV